jgi:hypothetical protein
MNTIKTSWAIAAEHAIRTAKEERVGIEEDHVENR